MEAVRFFISYWKDISPKEAKKIKRRTFFMVFFGVLAGVLNTVLIGLINKILNAVGGLNPIYIWVFVGLLVLLPLSKYFSETTVNYLFIPITTDLMRKFMYKFMTLPIQAIEKHGIAKYHAVLDQDLRIVYNALRALVFLSLQLTIVLSCLVYLGWLSLGVLAWTLLFLIGGLAVHRLILIKATGYLAKGREDYGREMKFFEASSLGIKEFKLHRERRKSFFENMVEPSFVKMTRHNLTGQNIFAIGMSLSTVLYFALIGTILFGSLMIFNVEREVLTGYALTVMFMLGPLERVIANTMEVFSSKISVRKMEEVGLFLKTRQGEETFVEEAEPLPEWQEIRMENVCYHFGDPGTDPGKHDFVLGPVSLKFRPGEVVMVAGGNGSGKTTLAKLLAGLYFPVSGKLFYNDIPIDESNRDRYRQTFSAVFVDFYLFRELLGFDHIPDLDNKARSYLQELEIGDKLDVEDGKLTTTDLSQGQRKRLALMITYLENRPFYIFDEWTAHQDPMFRDFFYREILPNLKKRGKTIFVITHDDKYFQAGDRLIKLDMGKIDLDISAASLKGKAPLELAGSLNSVVEEEK